MSGSKGKAISEIGGWVCIFYIADRGLPTVVSHGHAAREQIAGRRCAIVGGPQLALHKHFIKRAAGRSYSDRDGLTCLGDRLFLNSWSAGDDANCGDACFESGIAGTSSFSKIVKQRLVDISRNCASKPNSTMSPGRMATKSSRCLIPSRRIVQGDSVPKVK